ncbi:SMI1/KNR4 family protein [Capnocytophaga canis]|uniref:SMI1/KNR4 family protein n=1 Tax=Capnocytophaga canis TaxID=1848903 RepID=UPI0015627072|nr:SMI1/KNR4 family protein [Capnocytophaga canis]
MEFSQTEQKLTLAEMDDFERKIGLKLPQDFKEHYLKFNGGYPSFEYVKGLRNIFTINSFDSIKYGALPIEKLIDDFQESGVDFNNKIPFANDNGDNIFLISLDDSDYGKIYIIEAEFLEDKNYILVSESFTDFLNSFFNE